MSQFMCIFVYCLTVRTFICIYKCKHTQLTLQKCIDPSPFLSIFHFSVGPPDEKKPKYTRNSKTFWSVFKMLHNTPIHLPQILTFSSCSVLCFNCLTLFCPSKLIPILLCPVWTSVRVAFTDLASSQPVYKHDITCVPISARLSCRHSRLCRQRTPEKTKSLELFWFLFCLRILLTYLTRPFVCLCAFLLLRHICVSCCICSTRESLTFRWMWD